MAIVRMLKRNCSAKHLLGELGNYEEDQYVYIDKEKDDLFIGRFVLGMGFYDIEFKKEDIREMTDNEYEYFKYRLLSLGGNTYHNYRLNRDGSFMNDEEFHKTLRKVKLTFSTNERVMNKYREKVCYIEKTDCGIEDLKKQLVVFDSDGIIMFNSSRINGIVSFKNGDIKFSTISGNKYCFSEVE